MNLSFGCLEAVFFWGACNKADFGGKLVENWRKMLDFFRKVCYNGGLG